MNNRGKEILHLDMDAFFASVEQRTFPFLRDKPIAVCGDPDGRSVVSSASYPAKALGVKSGMNLYEARQRCPDILFVPLNPAKYSDTAERIINILIQFTDLVEVFSIDEAFLDVTDTVHLFGSSEMIARQIKDEIYQEMGLTCSIGIAPNKLLAKYASDQCKPNGLLRIKQEEIPKLLEDVPATELCGIGEKTALRLKKFGITTCGDLAKCSINILVQHFGKNGIKLKDMGLGFDPNPVLPYWFKCDAKSVGHSCTMDSDTNDLAVIKHLLWELSEQVARRLRQDNYQGKTVSLVLRYADFTTFSSQKSIKEFINDGRRIYEIDFDLFKVLYKPPRKVRLVGVSVSNLIKGITQLSLLNQETKDTTAALDKLNDKHGEFMVRRSVLADSPAGPRVISPSWQPRKQPH
jgi:DNA polymerase-4